jgi:hypothetical protein
MGIVLMGVDDSCNMLLQLSGRLNLAQAGGHGGKSSQPC